MRSWKNVPPSRAVGEDTLRDITGDREGAFIDTTKQVSGAAIVYRRLQQVGTLGALRTGIGGIGIDRKVERSTTLHRGDPVDLPSTQRGLDEAAIGRKVRNRVDIRRNQAMPDVEGSVTVIPPPVVGIHRRSAIVGVAGHIQRMRPSVTGVKLEAAI